MHKRGVDGFRVLQSEEKEKYQTIMLQITLDMYQTLAAAVVVLALGRFLRGRVRLLERKILTKEDSHTGAVLHPGSGHRRRAVRHFYLRMLWNGHCRVRL